MTIALRLPVSASPTDVTSARDAVLAAIATLTSAELDDATLAQINAARDVIVAAVATPLSISSGP